MSSKNPTRLSAVEQPSTELLTPVEFRVQAVRDWREAQDAYEVAHQRMGVLLRQMFCRRPVYAETDVAAARDNAQLLRDDVDRMVIALDHIVTTARTVQAEGEHR